MQITKYMPTLAAAVAASHTRVFAGVPLCFQISADDLADERQGCDNLLQLREQQRWVALEGERVVGYCHAACEDPKASDVQDWSDYDHPQGVLRIFWYEAGHRAAGEALLDAAEGHLAALGMPRIEVMQSKRGVDWHQAPHTNLTSHAAHISALLLSRGYAAEQCEALLTLRDCADWPVLPARVPLETRQDITDPPEELPTIIGAQVDGEDVGICVGMVLSAQSGDPAAAEWGYIRYLAVDGVHRRQGIAQHLLTLTNQALVGRGVRHLSLCCLGDNAPALLLYTNLGLQAVDYTYSYIKALEG